MAGILSSVEICNLALDHLKEESISSIESPVTNVEVLCKRWYDQVRRATLRKHPWNFAIKRVLLPELAEAPEFEYAKQYQLPSDFIRFLTIGTYGNQKRYQLEDNKILIDDVNELTSSGALPLRYIYDFTSVVLMDPLFIDVLAVEIAIRISYQITGSGTKGRDLAAMLADLAPAAYAVDGQERPPTRRETSRFKSKRRGHNYSVASPWTITETI